MDDTKGFLATLFGTMLYCIKLLAVTSITQALLSLFLAALGGGAAWLGQKGAQLAYRELKPKILKLFKKNNDGHSNSK